MSVNLEIVERLVHAKPPLPAETDELPANIADWPEDWREEYEERAAIMDKEYYGSLSREAAEAWAETIVRAYYRLHQKNTGERHA